MVAKKTDLPTLEASFVEIAALIEAMEQSDLTLEQSLSQFERGIHLVKHAQKILQEAEQKIQILTQHNNHEELTPYENKEK